MAREVRVPRLAESLTEAVLAAWLKEDGAPVALDEPIATLETDKAAMEIASDAAGVLRHARPVGETVQVGDVIARIEETTAESKDPGTARAPAPARKPAPPPESKPSQDRPPASAASTRRSDSGDGSRETGDEAALGPAVRRMVEEFGLDPAEIPASGRGGRLLKEDVVRYLEGAAARHQERPAETPSRAEPSRPEPPRAASARPAAEKPPGGTEAPRSPAADAWRESEEERVVAMSRIRQRIAEKLVQAQRTAAILTTFNEVDMTAVMELRQRFREGFESRHGVKLSFMSFFTRACVLALQRIPEINAEVRGTEIVYQRHVHMGIAVGTPRGLVVPVVHDADRRTFAELEKEIARLAAAARENRLSLMDLAGGTFTISNGGVYGSLLSTPILNPPQSGILGMHKIEKRPIAIDDQVVIRPMMYLALSYDHRIVDGEQAVTFLVSVKERLEDPERMLLDV